MEILPSQVSSQTHQQPLTSKPEQSHLALAKQPCIRKLMLEERSAKWPATSPNQDCMVVEDYQVKAPPPPKWIPELDLFLLDKRILLSSSEWLTDSIIDAAQTLIGKLASIGGLQRVCSGLTMSFNAEPSEFLQIMGTSTNGDHWILVSTIGSVHPKVFVYDSKYKKVNSFVEKQIASLLTTSHKEIELYFVNVQMQYGGSDCGLFTIAYATALALGFSPEHFHFKQEEMRSHLLQCLQDKKMAMFPYDRTLRARKRIKNHYSFRVYCSCRLPQFGKMIECSNCKEWFHLGVCIKVPEAALKQNVEWICKNCEELS